MGSGFLLDCKTVHFLREKRLGKELKHIFETIMRLILETIMHGHSFGIEVCNKWGTNGN